MRQPNGENGGLVASRGPSLSYAWHKATIWRNICLTLPSWLAIILVDCCPGLFSTREVLTNLSDLLYWHGVIPINVGLVSTLGSCLLVVQVLVDMASCMYLQICSCHY